ncbi:MAG: OmpA family protein [Flavobacteriales bacterium]|nr:OmpA family protein [Flavobacteriales bacterium]
MRQILIQFFRSTQFGLIGILLFLGIASSFAQQSLPETEKLSMRKVRGLAINSLRLGDTYSALVYYKEWSKRKPENVAVNFQLAELYRNSRDYAHASESYWKVLKLKGGADAYPMALYYAGDMDMQNGKYEDAKKNLLKFKHFAAEMKDTWYKKATLTKIEGCDLGISLRDSVNTSEVEHLDESINKAHIEFSPIPIDSVTLVYGSLVSDQVEFYDIETLDSTLLPKRKFYLAKKESGKWVSKGEFNEPTGGDQPEHIGNGALSPDGNRFYFTKCQENFQGKVICHLFFSEKENGKWGEPVEMNDQINLPNYTTTQPTIGRESKRNQEVIYFVSDRPEGKGGLDIWFTEYHARTKRFREPQNAGAVVNTPGTEFTPYYDVSTHTLYFSSDGNVGLGGLDVYKVEGEKSKWAKDSVQHLGKAVNSPADDFDFVLNKDRQTGFLVSNREGGVSLMNATCCDDIYAFEFVEYVNIHLKGLVIDSTCLDDVDIFLYMNDPETGTRYLAEELRGNPCTFSFTLEPGREYSIEAKKTGYFNDVVHVSTMKLTPADTLTKELKLEKIPRKPIVLNGINYGYDSADLTADAKISLDTGLYPIMTDNPQIIIELSSHTDSKGSDDYNLKLSERRAKSVVDYMISKGIDPQRLVPKGYGENKPIALNEFEDGTDNPDGRARNRRTEFEIIGELSEDQYLPEQD